MGLAVHLDLETTAGAGRKKAAVAIGAVIPLELADLVQLDEPRGNANTTINKISTRHHAIARMLADGAKNWEIAASLNYTESRISILKGDPAMDELVAFYKAGMDAEYLNFHKQLAGLGTDALGELRRRVEDEPEKMGATMLLEVITKMADRVGHGPSSSSTSVNINVGIADKMALARVRAEDARKALLAPTIEGDVIDV